MKGTFLTWLNANKFQLTTGAVMVIIGFFATRYIQYNYIQLPNEAAMKANADAAAAAKIAADNKANHHAPVIEESYVTAPIAMKPFMMAPIKQFEIPA